MCLRAGRGWELPAWGRTAVTFLPQISRHGAKRIRAPAGAVAGEIAPSFPRLHAWERAAVAMKRGTPGLRPLSAEEG